MKAAMRGLYVITDHAMPASQALLDKVEAAIMGGASVVQYRDKTSSPEICEQNAMALKALCHERGALLIINDDVLLAQRTNADGVHLGCKDASLSDARSRLGAAKIIGVSCYSGINNARQAQHDGADYVAFGRFFPSKTKPDAVSAKPKILHKARKKLQIPIVAIGGITAENGAPLVAAGADMLAVADGVFGQRDVLGAAARITALFGP